MAFKSRHEQLDESRKKLKIEFTLTLAHRCRLCLINDNLIMSQQFQTNAHTSIPLMYKIICIILMCMCCSIKVKQFCWNMILLQDNEKENCLCFNLYGDENIICTY